MMSPRLDEQRDERERERERERRAPAGITQSGALSLPSPSFPRLVHPRRNLETS